MNTACLKSFRTYSKLAKPPRKSVIISKSNDIFENLALEDWLYAKRDFANENQLMLWKNQPCVVIGRHQSPWLEANFAALEKSGVKLARRNSGGGAVFHDSGNLNLTFFTCRDGYNRKRNLELIVKVLERHFRIHAEISSREDITVDGYKVSGTASKLGRLNAYHHCTLLVDSAKEVLSASLKKTELNIETNATKSTRSKIINLKEINSQLTVDNLMARIGEEYASNNIEFVEPTEENYPGFNETLQTFCSWEWIYGRTPKFTISTSIQPDIDKTLQVKLVVEKGIIQNVTISSAAEQSTNKISLEAPILTGLEGEKFDKTTLNLLESNAVSLFDELEIHIRDFFKNVI